jgi:hypothetical protein
VKIIDEPRRTRPFKAAGARRRFPLESQIGEGLSIAIVFVGASMASRPRLDNRLSPPMLRIPVVERHDLFAIGTPPRQEDVEERGSNKPSEIKEALHH